jgi:DNA polymerase/3'-5' exonuclease PolX
MSAGLKQDRKPLAEALAFADGIAAALGRVGVPRSCVHYAGSLRRQKPTVGDLDILVVTETGDDESIYLKLITELQANGREVVVEVCGGRHCSMLVDGFLVELKQNTPANYGAAMLFMTGSGDFNKQMRVFAKVTGFKLSQYGLADRENGKVIASETEAAIFDALGVEYIAPADRSEFRAVLTVEPSSYLPSQVDFVPATTLPVAAKSWGKFKRDYQEAAGEDAPQEAAADDLPDPIMCGIGRVFDLAACHA